ncbi:olfactory receptor 1L4-like [Lissotriton helveticus]
MEKQNLSMNEDFLVVGFSDLPQLQIPLFLVFLLIYLFTFLGNVLIMITIYSNSHLHTPMYFFLTDLSFLDFSYTLVIFPKMLCYFFMKGTHVSLTECLIQLYFFMGIASVEFLLLTIMAYDRYVAICNPFHYMTIMKKAVCMRLAVGSWGAGLLNAIPHIVLMSRLSFCKSHTINHFFCDMTALLQISCTNTVIIDTLNYINGFVIAIMSFILIIISYSKITSSILKMKSKVGQHKAFSTCASHLTVVMLYYGSVVFTYMRPTSSYSMSESKISSLAYVAITPLCNPIIYSLKNTELKNALLKRKAQHQV